MKSSLVGGHENGVAPIMDKVLSTYEGTRFEIRAQVDLISFDTANSSINQRLEALDLLALKYLPFSVSSVFEAEVQEMVIQELDKLSPEMKRGVSEVFGAYLSEIITLPEREPDAIRLALFNIKAFKDFGPTTLLGLRQNLKNILIRKKFGRYISQEDIAVIDPSVVQVFPTPGDVVESPVAVTFQIESGDYRQPPVFLDSIKVYLDGQAVEVSNTTLEHNLNLQNDVAFERINVELLPVELSPGGHTLSVSAQVHGYSDGGPGHAEKEWTFEVRREAEDASFPVIQDTIISLRNQHQNDGSNHILTLEKDQGKATRNAVAFNLDGVNFAGLSSATLVLTIDTNQAVNGWGNGRTISAQTITTPWQEGNGRNFGLKKKDQIAGDGAGATWFSPIDENIGNDSSDSAVNWNGAASSVSPPTSPAVQIVNFQSGEVAFDVTADVLSGAEHGWLILKDQENAGSKVSFYSREGAAAAGNPDLAPRLLLEFGQVASNSSGAQSETLLSRIGFGAIGSKLRPISGREVRSVKQLLQENRVAALAVEQLVSQATLTNPVANWSTRLAYRSWVSESIQIAANIEMAKS